MQKQKIMNILEAAMEKGRAVIDQGTVADYIPELGKADKHKLGICLHTIDGQIYGMGDYEERFTIQSIGKVIALAMAMETFEDDKILAKVGVEPSGEAFNSLVDLDLNHNRPYNPMINSGALTIASMLLPNYSFYDFLAFAKKLCLDPDIDMDEAIFHSEILTCSRNKSIAYLLESKDIIDVNVEDTLNYYTKMCSLRVTAKSLANLGLVLANDGIDPTTGERLIKSRTARAVKTIMFTCGMYDGSGEFALKVGIPSKSGVGGGLLSAADRKMGIGIFGPSLDANGNCIAGKEMLEYISMKLELHLFYTSEWEDLE